MSSLIKLTNFLESQDKLMKENNQLRDKIDWLLQKPINTLKVPSVT